MAVFLNVTVSGSSKIVLPSPMTEMENILLAKNTVLSLPRNTAVCEIKELLRRTFFSCEEKREPGRTALSSSFCTNSIAYPPLVTAETSTRLTSISKLSSKCLSVCPGARPGPSMLAILSNEDTILQRWELRHKCCNSSLNVKRVNENTYSLYLYMLYCTLHASLLKS